jgi:hypothetical protein
LDITGGYKNKNNLERHASQNDPGGSTGGRLPQIEQIMVLYSITVPAQTTSFAIPTSPSRMKSGEQFTPGVTDVNK